MCEAEGGPHNLSEPNHRARAWLTLRGIESCNEPGAALTLSRKLGIVDGPIQAACQHSLLLCLSIVSHKGVVHCSSCSHTVIRGGERSFAWGVRSRRGSSHRQTTQPNVEVSLSDRYCNTDNGGVRSASFQSQQELVILWLCW